ncbi:probable disease resistance protein At4g27220 [Eucalyptus grandis]|uniref:probable disease resistance protein At4g27220 n=1 Tax=Eucalyptus grandis TaxID=71139 RepID=UPI00192EA810|nr:probable disease resistance protein At4g27220 [Eucalyptus grandis]
MPRETDPFWKYVKLLPNKHWNCNFCGNSYAGSATRIKAHLAGVGGYGINDCKNVDGRVRSEARKAMKGKKVVESSSRPDNDEVGLHQPVIASNEDGRPVIASNEDGRPVIASNEDGQPVIASNEDGQPVIPSNENGRRETSFVAMPYLSSNAISNGRPVIASNEDGRRETSFLAMPYLSSNAISTVGASSSDFHPSHEMNVPSQYLPTQNMTTHGDFSFWTQPPQSHAVDSNIQPWNLSYPGGGGDLAPEALTNMPPLVNVEGGEPNAEVPQDARTDDALVDSQPIACGLVNENMPSLKRKLEELSNQEADMDGLETWCRKAQRISGEYWSTFQAFREGRSLSPQQVERVNDLSKEVKDILGHCSFPKGSTTHAAGCRKSLPLETTELVDKESKETIEKICGYLMEDEIFVIGICGMVGVGKTAILMHVYNRVLENLAFNDVFWVTVPQEFNVYALQNEIANALGLDNLSKDRDVKRRACILNRHLKSRRAVLCLDGLWMHFDIEDVGIPVENAGIRLVLTTRSLDVCHKMVCQKQVEISPLYRPDDCWVLFLKTLCFGRDLPSEVKKIASSILDKCGGLPLGIIEIATHMKELKAVHEWKGLLQRLENSMMELNVLKKLKLSFVNLGNLQVEQCLLHLILCFGEYFSEDEIIKKVLIESFIDEGLLSGMATRQELHDRGNTILDKIKRACLGVNIDEERLLVHPLIRDMALQIVTSTTHMVKANMGLKEIPEDKFWTDHLEKVFLQSNDIEEIPYGISPNCPKLMRLSLNNNVSLEAIHKSFFKHMKGLKVLDLSKTKITELPDTMSHLESLEALLLRGCEELRCVPCVRKLGSLRKLDMSGCTMLEEVPKGMEMLVKLMYLDLHGTKIKTLLEGVLGKLVNLQYLVIKKVTAKEEEEEEEEEEEIKLTKVEGFYCSVLNVETFNACVRLLERNSSQPYELWLNELGEHSFRNMHERHIIIKSCRSIAARVDGEIGGDGHALLPKNVRVLEVGRCNGVTSLCEVGPLYDLEELKIEKWEKLEELGAVHFPRLRRLYISGCSKLKRLLKEGHDLQYLQWFKIEGSEELEGIDIVAPSLYSIEVYGCPKMKRVVEWEWLETRLPNLRSIKIKHCEQLKEIIGERAGPAGATYCLAKIEIEGCKRLERVLMMWGLPLSVPFLRHLSVKDCKGIEVIISSAPATMHLNSNLTHLTLWKLPALEAIYDETVSCHSIECIDIRNCPTLKRLPKIDDGLPCPPRVVKNIWIDQQLSRLRLLEWRQSLFQPVLERLARIHEPREEELSDQSIVKYIDRIAARVDEEIGGDGCNLPRKDVQVLTVGRGSGATSLSKLSSLKNLEELTTEDCEKLEELGAVHFHCLRVLKIARCSKLKHLSVKGDGFPHLLWFEINGLEELEQIDLAAPSLKLMEVSQCSKMKRVVEGAWLATSLPDLKSIRIQRCEKLEEIIGGPLPTKHTCLTKIEIDRCNNMKGVLLTHDVLPHLPSLQQITVENCEGIEMIIGTAPDMTQSSFPEFTRLTLRNLPELKEICDWINTCDHIQFIEITRCPKLKRIPLPLRPRDSGLLSPPPSPGQILMDQETWQALDSGLLSPPLPWTDFDGSGDVAST